MVLHDNLAASLDNMGSNFEVQFTRMDPGTVTKPSTRRKIIAEKIRSTI